MDIDQHVFLIEVQAKYRHQKKYTAELCPMLIVYVQGNIR